MSRFPSAYAVLTEAIREHAFPGAAYGVFLRGDVVAVESVGAFTYEPGAIAVQPETLFDMASVSKVLATTAMAMLLWQRGILDLDEPIYRRLPDFAAAEKTDDRKRKITPRMLLAHSSGLPAYERLYQRHTTADALLHACLRMPLESPPDTRAVYSDIGFIILGLWLETLAAERIDSFCRREIFTPLGMVSTKYRPPLEWKLSIPPTRMDDPLRHRVIQGEVHDDNCWLLGGVSGHAGVFSNVADTLRFAACILRGGEPIFSSQTISLFTKPHPLSHRLSGQDRALGWDTPSPPSSSGNFFSTHSAGHLGYTGTSLWIDFDRDLAIVLLTNRTFPGNGPEGVSQQIQQVRPRFHDALMRELGLTLDL